LKVKQDYDAYITSQEYIDKKIAERKQRKEQMILREIVSWASLSDSSSPNAGRNNISLPVDDLDEAVLNTWKSELESSGYIVKIDDGIFTVSLQ